MTLPKLVLKAPVLTASGYGVHSRQVLRALLAFGQFDVSIKPITWGQTPFIYGDDPLINVIKNLSAKYEQEHAAGFRDYDVSIQVTIPNEFEKMAKVNIGITAGIEVDRVSPSWIVKANEVVDLVIVPSHHSAKTFGGVEYTDPSGQKLHLQKPITVCAEGADARFFNTNPLPPEDHEHLKFDTKFNFLSVGLGLDKPFGEDRKNLSALIKWFCERFKDDKEVGLVLKVSLVNNSLMDFEMTQKRINEFKALSGAGEFPRIHLVHGRMTDREMAALYKHPQIKAYVSLTHGEGFGLPILEAAACGLPIIATDWSGHTDFLTIDGKKKFVPIEFDLKEIPDSAVWNGVMEKGTRWAEAREEDAKLKMKKVVLSYDKPKEWAVELAEHVKQNYTLEKVSYQLVKTIGEFLNQFQGNRPVDAATAKDEIKAQLKLESNQKSLLYTMPMSGGDVFISTGVVKALRKKFPHHKIFFATQQKYASIIQGNTDVDAVIGFADWMSNIPFCEEIFDEVYTPNLSIQTNASNWIHGGKGRRLADEMAAQCHVDLEDYFIQKNDVAGLPEKFIAVHPGSGKGQWESRNYLHWQDVVTNLSKLSGLPIIKVGLEEDRLIEGVTDLRGRTTYGQLAEVISKASVLVGIDSITMHMAAHFGTPHVALFGSSYANSTGPVSTKSKLSILMETSDRYSCSKACYKNACKVDKLNPCVNEIKAQNVVGSTMQCLLTADPGLQIPGGSYAEYRPQIAGYTHVLNAEGAGYPYIESIKSMLGFCDEVVVIDGGSTDGTVEKIKAIGDERVKVYVREWDWNEPGMDGMQKAYGRAMCSVGPSDFLWQQDADEVVHERDYQKIRELVKRFPQDVNLLHLPVVELWGGEDRFRTDRHSWKWRLSRNDFRITHGINKDARVFDEKTGKTFAKKGQSDGCEYIDIMTGEFVPHAGFYSRQLEELRRTKPAEYGREMNMIFGELPSVFHYSWFDLERKIKNFKEFWNKCWSNLYNDEKPVDRFPGVETEEQIKEAAEKLKKQGGEHGPGITCLLDRPLPLIMKNRYPSLPVG